MTNGPTNRTDDLYTRRLGPDLPPDRPEVELNVTFVDEATSVPKVTGRNLLNRLNQLAERTGQVEAQAGQLTCRTFAPDGTSVCDKPAKYVVWGHLYQKLDKGPKCAEHAPETPIPPWLGGQGAIYEIPDVDTLLEVAHRQEKALRGVLARHFKDANGQCGSCTSSLYGVPYPCPEVLEIADALGGAR